MKRKKCKFYAFCLILLLSIAMLQGCGDKSSETNQNQTKQEETKQKETTTAEDLLADMKEFSNADKSAFIHLNNKWTADDLGAGAESFLSAGNSTGNESVYIFQFPKGGMFNITSIDSLKTFVETSFSMSEIKEETAFEVPGMSDVELVSAKVTSQGHTGDVYLIYGETDYAYYSIGYISTKINDKMKRSFEASCSTFREEVPEVEDRTTVELTDTVRWFNAAYAILTSANGWDYNRIGGLPANDSTMAIVQAMLQQSWDVTDRATADETLEWILKEGHSADCIDNMKYLEQNGIKEVAEDKRAAFVLENFDVTEEVAQIMANCYAKYEQYGENVIVAWDYSRALSLAAFYYLAGYYTEQEAMDKSLEIATKLQSIYESWDEMMEGYFLGYEYWAEESSEERRAIYEDIKKKEGNPYQVDYKITLEKTW